MAAKVQKKKSLNITAILDVAEGGAIRLEVEDCNDPLLLADLIRDFNGDEVKITITQLEDLV